MADKVLSVRQEVGGDKFNHMIEGQVKNYVGLTMSTEPEMVVLS
jgi:hypothetical protein